MAIIGWRKSSGVPVQATRVNKEPVNDFEIRMAASNKSHPVSIFHVCTYLDT